MYISRVNVDLIKGSGFQICDSFVDPFISGPLPFSYHILLYAVFLYWRGFDGARFQYAHSGGDVVALW